jgi:hypothetical protein
MSLVYLICIAPCALAYGAVLQACLHHTSSYPFSLFALALVHTIWTTPLRRIINRAPPYLCASLTLAQHIPFLMGLYYVIVESVPYPASLYAIVADGRKPDLLLGSINALPLVALLLQVGLVLTTPRSSPVGRYLGLATALAFGGILYQAPAHLLLFWISALVLGIWLHTRHTVQDTKAIPDHAAPAARGSEVQRLVFGSAVLVIATLLCVFGPAMLYLSDPHAYFHQGLLQVLRSSIPVMGIIVLSSVTAWAVSPQRARRPLCFLVTFCALASLLFASSTVPDYGVVDGFALSGFKSVTTLSMAIADVAIISAAAVVTWALFRYKRPLEIVAFFLVITTALAAYPVTLAFAHRKPVDVPRTSQLKAALEFSKEGKNTLIFMLDMFTGTHIKQMIDESPDIMKKFVGFTWYPDTVATGNITLLGFPPIVGGHSFLAAELNKDQASTNKQKLARAHALLPQVFATAGGRSSLLNTPAYLDVNEFKHLLGQSAASVQVIPDATQITYKADMKATGSSLYSIAISLFRMAPNFLRPMIYHNGDWLGAAKAQDAFRETKSQVAFLTSLPTLSATTSSTDTLKVIYSLLTHCYYHLQKDVVDFVKDPDPSTPDQPHSTALRGDISREHFYTEEHTLRFLGAYFDWLRENGVYDNTKIILTSDHSWADSRMLSDSFGGNHSYPGRPAGLLMIKDFNAAGPLKVSPHYMSTADVPFFACSHLGSEKCEPNTSVRSYLQQALVSETPIDRERTHDVSTKWTIERHPSNSLELETHRVRNSMFRRENWDSASK